jgi:hypothetical protein
VYLANLVFRYTFQYNCPRREEQFGKLFLKIS